MPAGRILKRMLVTVVVAAAAGCGLFCLLVGGALIVGMPSKVDGAPVWRPAASAPASSYTSINHIGK